MRAPQLVTTTDLALYGRTASDSAAVVINRYSTSFGWASALLPRRTRTHIARIYALVRVADELVDGPGAAAGLAADELHALLDALERETLAAIERGFSTNLVVHAFALTAREHGIGAPLIAPFFASMRADLDGEPRAGDELDAYIFGSAEVVGLMCLAVFEHGRTRTGAEQATLEEGARSLGAAFQKVNFLRDIAADRDELGRRYVPGGGRELTERAKTAQLADIRADLAAADRAIPLLDRGSRPAVWAARAFFGALADRIDRTPAAVVARERVRVPNGEKAGILVRALLRRWTR